MKKIIFLLFILFSFKPLLFAQNCDSLLLESITNPGPFIVSSINENLSGIRNGNDYDGATIFYPDNNSSFLASIILVPGFMNTELTIQNWGSFFASHGIVTITIGTNALTDTHIQRRDALLDAIVSLKYENNRLASPLYQRLDTLSIAVGGFSKGGGGAQLVPSIDSTIKAIVALYPWLDNPSASDLNHNIPLMIISGQLDAIAPPSIHADIHYTLTPNTTEKLKYEVAFASHDAISGPYAGNGEVGIRVFSFLQHFLLEDSCYCPIVLSNPFTASSYITNIVCNDLTYLPSYSNVVKKVVQTIDIFGRISDKSANNLFLDIYDDGTVEKRIIIK